jgi:zinc ribbon protein
MALACPRCGTQNPDGNSFCQACGSALNTPPPQPAMPVGATAASPFTQPPPVYTSPPPGSGYAPPPPPAGGFAPPPAYQTPYYAPPPGMAMPQVHRTPWLLVVAIIGVLVLVMAGVGTVLAVGLSHSSNQTASNLNELSSPSPAGSPSPVPSPTSQPTSSGPKTVSNAGVTVPVPDGWSVVEQDDETITLVNPDSNGAITIASGPSNPAQNAQANKATVDAFFKQQYPDTKNCAGSKTSTGSLNGVAGISWELCFTLTSGAQSMAAAALLFVGANSSGTVYYAMYMLTAAANMPAFNNECAPILKGLKWSLK